MTFRFELFFSAICPQINWSFTRLFPHGHASSPSKYPGTPVLIAGCSRTLLLITLSATNTKDTFCKQADLRLNLTGIASHAVRLTGDGIVAIMIHIQSLPQRWSRSGSLDPPGDERLSHSLVL